MEGELAWAAGMREAKTMRSKQIMAATAVALLAGVAACTGGRSGTVYNSSFTVGYDPRSLSAAMSRAPRSEEHPSELQSLMRNSYAAFGLQQKQARQLRPVTR